MVTLTPPRARRAAFGLRGLWARVRRSVLRLGPSAARTPSLPDTPSHQVDDPNTFLEPRGAVERRQPVRIAPPPASALLPPVREGLEAVAPLPHVVRELLRELSDPDSTARTVARIAASDPALAAALIRTVNSAAMGLRRKITSVTEAVSYLGYSVVRSLVIRMRLEQVLPAPGGQAGYDAEDLWVHSLAVSYAADCLAQRARGADGAPLDRGFVATLGLLHDIGKLAINSQFPASAALLKERDPNFAGESFLDRERRVLGADHAEIGAFLAAHWKLPADLVDAIRWHHEPAAMPATFPAGVRTATNLVHLANQLTKYCYVYSEDMEIDIVPDELFHDVGLAGPLPRLLCARTRGAISRAIYFADESATRPLGRPLAAVRRFVRLYDADEARQVPQVSRGNKAGEARVRIARDGKDWSDLLFQPGCPTVECPSRRRPRGAPAAEALAPRRKVFTARLTQEGVESLVAEAAAHQDALPLSEDVRLPARFLVRRLVPNLMEVARPARTSPSVEGEAHTVTLAQYLDGGRLYLAIRSPALASAHRFGPEFTAHMARRVLDRELANVLNLRWFNHIQMSRDGATLVFISHESGRP